MVQSGRLVARTSLALGGLLACLAAPAAGQPPVAGSIKQLTGTASVVRGGQELPAAVGQPITIADTVRTGADSTIGITFKDGTRLSLGSNTEVQVSAFAYSPAEGEMALALKILRGVASYISGRIAELAPGAVKIETPTSVIGIRGTHVLVGVDRP